MRSPEVSWDLLGRLGRSSEVLRWSLEVLRRFMGSQCSQFSFFCNPYVVICMVSRAQHGPGARDVNGCGGRGDQPKVELGGLQD